MFALLLALVCMPAHGFELSVETEHRVQIASIATAYSFSALHTVLLGRSALRRERLASDWVPGTGMAAISTVGLSVGYLVLAIGFDDDPDAAATHGLAASAGLILGGWQLAATIDGFAHWDGDPWMEPGPAAVTLVHGASLSVFGTLLAFGTTPEQSDLSKLAPIYTWAVTGLILAVYSALSLAHGKRSRVVRLREAEMRVCRPRLEWRRRQDSNLRPTA